MTEKLYLGGIIVKLQFREGWHPNVYHEIFFVSKSSQRLGFKMYQDIRHLKTNNLYNLYNSEFPLICPFGQRPPGVGMGMREGWLHGTLCHLIPWVFVGDWPCKGSPGWLPEFFGSTSKNWTMSIAISDIPTFALLFCSGIFPAFLVWPIWKPRFSLGSFTYLTKQAGS